MLRTEFYSIWTCTISTDESLSWINTNSQLTSTFWTWSSIIYSSTKSWTVKRTYVSYAFCWLHLKYPAGSFVLDVYCLLFYVNLYEAIFCLNVLDLNYLIFTFVLWIAKVYIHLLIWTLYRFQKWYWLMIVFRLEFIYTR